MSIYLDRIPGRSFSHQGEEYLYFGGTSYLGLNTDTEFQALYRENLDQYGINHGASRNSNIRLSIFDQAEEQLAHRLGVPAAAVLSSGYLAGQLLRHFFSSEKFEVFHASSAHSALRMNGDHNVSHARDLQIKIDNFFALSESKTPVLFFDSISFDRHGFPDFDWIRELPLKKMILVADDSHGIGVVGEGGCGVYRTLAALQAKELIVCASLNKAPAVQAGVILGENWRIQQLKSTAIFAGASPPSPAGLATFLSAISLYQKRLKKLRENQGFFLQHVDNSDYFEFCPGHPAFSYSDDRLTHILKNNRIIVTDFNYAGASQPNINRIVVSAHHREDDIARIALVINDNLELN